MLPSTEENRPNNVVGLRFRTPIARGSFACSEMLAKVASARLPSREIYKSLTYKRSTPIKHVQGVRVLWSSSRLVVRGNIPQLGRTVVYDIAAHLHLGGLHEIVLRDGTPPPPDQRSGETAATAKVAKYCQVTDIEDWSGSPPLGI
eukprot:70007-Prorocentrum_minimum.AAC.3